MTGTKICGAQLATGGICQRGAGCRIAHKAAGSTAGAPSSRLRDEAVSETVDRAAVRRFQYLQQGLAESELAGMLADPATDPRDVWNARKDLAVERGRYTTEDGTNLGPMDRIHGVELNAPGRGMIRLVEAGSSAEAQLIASRDLVDASPELKSQTIRTAPFDGMTSQMGALLSRDCVGHTVILRRGINTSYPPLTATIARADQDGDTIHLFDGNGDPVISTHRDNPVAVITVQT